jgi:hypothetical protein
MSENVGASTSRNPKDLHGLYRDNFTFYPYYLLGALLATCFQTGSLLSLFFNPEAGDDKFL